MASTARPADPASIPRGRLDSAPPEQRSPVPAAAPGTEHREAPGAEHREAPGARGDRDMGLDLLRVVAICGVVAIHIFGLLVSAEGSRGTAQWWVATAVNIGAIWTVPAFIMISGVFALDPRAHRDGPAAFYRRRFARILPAMIVWHLVYLVLVRLVMRDEQLNLISLGRMAIDSRVFTGLYFLWLIAGLYVVAPVLAAFLNKGGPRRAHLTAAVALGWTMVAYMVPGVALLLGISRPNVLTSWNRWWPYVGFLLAGWALRKTVLSRRGTVVAAAVAAALLAEGVWQYGVAPAHRIVQAVFPVMATGTLMAAATVLIFVVAVSIGSRWRPGPGIRRPLTKLAEASFGVFLIHLLVYETLRLVAPALAEGRSLAAVASTYLVVLVVSFLVSLAARRVPYVRTVF